MAFTTAQLTALEDAIAKGELEVVFDGKSVKYQSFEDLRKRYEFVRDQLIASGALASSAKRVSYAAFTKD